MKLFPENVPRKKHSSIESSLRKIIAKQIDSLCASRVMESDEILQSLSCVKEDSVVSESLSEPKGTSKKEH